MKPVEGVQIHITDQDRLIPTAVVRHVIDQAKNCIRINLNGEKQEVVFLICYEAVRNIDTTIIEADLFQTSPRNGGNMRSKKSKKPINLPISSVQMFVFSIIKMWSACK
jgi:hypothetical protein